MMWGATYSLALHPVKPRNDCIIASVIHNTPVKSLWNASKPQFNGLLVFAHNHFKIAHYHAQP